MKAPVTVCDSYVAAAEINSVRWPICNQSEVPPGALCLQPLSFAGVCVSCTLDTGQYLLFDLRSKITKPAYAANFGKPVSFCLRSA
jgi:hypothetical protein